MKKVALLVSIVMVLVIFTGCKTSRTPINADTFIAKAEAAGYIVQDAADERVENFLIAIKGTDSIDYQIEFIVVSTVEQAKSAYQENYNKIESKKGTSSVHSSASIGNYSYYKLTTDGRYYVISRTENTFIYIDASAEYKNEISNFLSVIGY